MEDLSKTGHNYKLNNHENPKDYQLLQFIEKEAAPDGSGFVVVQDGTTNEEVLKMLIDRCQKLNTKLPSKETTVAIICLQEALMHFNARTLKRQAQGVENTPLPHKD